MHREIPGYEGLYAVSDNGLVWSLQTTQSRRKGPLKPYSNEAGYLRVNLFKNGKMRHEYVHRLVAKTFLPNPSGFSVVNHKDADPTNNRVDNLEWCDQKYNIGESRRLGHQAKDQPVVAVSITTGEVREYPTMKAAGIDLFGKYWALRYHFRKKGAVFSLGAWRFEVGK